jgi:hypothetical protein
MRLGRKARRRRGIYTVASATGDNDGNLLEYEIVSTTGAYTATAAQGSSDVWVMQLVTFR